MSERRGGESAREKILRALNAPLTLWLFSAIGIGIFSSAYSGRSQCLADARRALDDYEVAGLEWNSRVQSLVPIVFSDTPESANAVIANARKISATRQFKDASAYDVALTLDRARQQIAFPESDDALTSPVDLDANPLFKLQLLKANSAALQYDHSIPADQSVGIVAGVASTSIGPDPELLATVKIAVRNAVIVMMNASLRDQRYALRPNCSYTTVLRQMLTGEPQPVLQAVATRR